MRNRQLASSLVLVLVVLLLSTGGSAQVIVVRFAPPALPVYDQPPCPADNYIWVPGYWAWDPNFYDYFWVPGTWVLAPEPGYLWTPGYWAWNGSGFFFNEGYWAPVVGYYGGINYGYGYFGKGYEGGRWDHGRFYYNRAVNNVNITRIHNVYNTTVNNITVNRVSYNGGPGGITARPNPQEEVPQRRLAPVEAQTRHLQTARGNQQLRASMNQGKPPIAATQEPASFSGGSVVPAQQAGAPYHPPASRAANQSGGEQQAHPQKQAPNYTHARDVPPHQQPTPPPDTGDAKAQQQYREQQQLYEQQNREHEQMAQQQEREHQQAQQQHANQAQIQQMEREHQEQTQRMEEQHAQQQRQMQERQASPAHAAPPPQPHGASASHN